MPTSLGALGLGAPERKADPMPRSPRALRLMSLSTVVEQVDRATRAVQLGMWTAVGQRPPIFASSGVGDDEVAA